MSEKKIGSLFSRKLFQLFFSFSFFSLNSTRLGKVHRRREGLEGWRIDNQVIQITHYELGDEEVEEEMREEKINDQEEQKTRL